MIKFILIAFCLFSTSLFGQISFNNSVSESAKVDLVINLTDDNKDSINLLLNTYIENKSLLSCRFVELRCNNTIKDLPDNFFLLNWITSLKIVGVDHKNDSIKEVIDERFNVFCLLENLTLDYLPIYGISENLKLPNLKEFRSISNSLSVFPEAILGDNLEVLVIQDNPIKHIPSSIKLARNLKEVSFFNTPIKILPLEFYELKELTCLNLEATNITTISDSIMSFTKLEYLNLLTAMFLDDIPNCLCDLPNLKCVSVLSLEGKPTCFENTGKWNKKGLVYERIK